MAGVITAGANVAGANVAGANVAGANVAGANLAGRWDQPSSGWVTFSISRSGFRMARWNCGEGASRL